MRKHRKWQPTTIALTLAAALVMLAGPASAQRAQDLLICPDPKADTQDRIRSCSAIIASDKTSPQVKVATYDFRGAIFSFKGDFARAIADYSAAIQLEPTYPHPYANRGTLWDRLGNPDRAIADLSRAIELDPRYASAYQNRGVAWSHKGDLDRSIADLDRAIELDPKSADARYNRGLSWYRKGDMDHAISDYDQALQLDPRRTLAYNNRGLAFQAKGDLDRALADFDAAIRSDPQFAGAYGNRANVWERKGDFDRGIADSSEAITLDPKSMGFTFFRGRMYLYTGMPQKALTDLTRASELDPKYPYAALWLDIANRHAGQASRLAEAAKQLDMTKWPAPIIRLYLGEVTPDALASAADDPDSATKQVRLCEVNFYGAELLLQQGAKDEAARRFALAAADCPAGLIESTAAKVELKALGAQ